jgi:hypothetical protein
MKLLIMYFPPFSCYFFINQNITFITSFSLSAIPCTVREEISYPLTSFIVVSYVLITIIDRTQAESTIWDKFNLLLISWYILHNSCFLFTFISV